MAVITGQNEYKAIPLGKNINTEYDEKRPLISPDGKTLYFIRQSHPENTIEKNNAEKTKGSQDIWLSTLDKDNKWTPAQHMGAPFNQQRYNSIFSISPDGNTLMVRGNYVNGEYIDAFGYSLSNKSGEEWSNFDRLAIPGLADICKGRYMGGFMTNDKKAVFMYFSEKESDDNSDIYVSRKISETQWSEPEKLKVINTKSDEMAPFMASDGKTLYFSSDRSGGLGKHDIYKTEMLDEKFQKWSEPINLGNTINSSDDDLYYSIDATGDYAYMVTEKNALGGSDIVKIKLKEENKPKPVMMISGKILNKKTGQPMKASIKYETLPEGQNIGSASSNPNTGEYKITLPCGKNYSFHAEAEGFIAISENLDLIAINEYKEMNRDLYLVPIEVGQVVRLNNIFFDVAKSDLRSESFPELDRVVEFMNLNPGISIEVSGHTDNSGTDSFNNLLSANRAFKVREYLVITGKINADRITSKGYGSSKPVAANTTDEGKQMNRRVEFTIMKK